VRGRLRPALFVLACAVAVVMLIVCANLSNLQLARTASRRREMAIRIALGAGRGRLIRQLLTESVVLSCAAAVLGPAAGYRRNARAGASGCAEPPAAGERPCGPRRARLHFAHRRSHRSHLRAAAAFQAPSAAIHDSLKDSNRGSSDGKHHAWVRSTLVVSEIAFACVLLVGAGLLIRSFLRVLDVNLGFRPEKAAAMRVDPSPRYNTRALRNALLRRGAAPGKVRPRH